MVDPAAKSDRPHWDDISPLNSLLPGQASIFHRVGGLKLLLGLFWQFYPVSYLLEVRFASPKSFAKFMAIAARPLAKLARLEFIRPFLHHCCAGIRFLLMGIHIGTTFTLTRKSIAAVFAVGLILTMAIYGILSGTAANPRTPHLQKW